MRLEDKVASTRAAMREATGIIGRLDAAFDAGEPQTGVNWDCYIDACQRHGRLQLALDELHTRLRHQALHGVPA